MEQLSLLNEIEKKISLVEIVEKNFDFFKNQKNLNLSNKKEIENFLYDYNWQNPLYYHCSLDFNTAINNKKYKYLIVEYNNDEILILYKIIQFMNVKKVKIIDKPFSLHKNKTNELKLIEELLKKEYFSILFKEKYIDFYKGYIFTESVQDFDYYVDFDEEYSKSFLPKYKHKKRINRFENNKDFKIEFVNEITDYKLFDTLRNVWKEAKQNVKNDNSYNLFITNNQTKKMFFNIYYQSKLIFNSCFIVMDDYLINVFENSCSKHYQQTNENTYLKNAMAYIVDVANYYVSKEFVGTNIKRSYIAGANPKHIELIEFKEKHSNGKIKYYKIN